MKLQEVLICVIAIMLVFVLLASVGTIGGSRSDSSLSHSITESLARLEKKQEAQSTMLNKLESERDLILKLDAQKDLLLKLESQRDLLVKLDAQKDQLTKLEASIAANQQTQLQEIRKQQQLPQQQQSTSDSSTKKLDREKKNVFFDLGANRGDSALQFVGIEKSSHGGGTTAVDRIPFNVPGPWDVILYEAHPMYDQDLEETKEKIEAIDKAKYGAGPFHVIKHNGTAIGWTEGTTEFYLEVSEPDAKKVGSSLFKGHPWVANGANLVKVPIHDLAKEIKTKYTIEDYVVVKMDLEGIEYDLCMDLLLRGAFPYIDELYVEFHHFSNYGDREKALEKIILNEAPKFMKVGTWG